MVQCKNCKSIKVIVRNGNFASRKNEGEPAQVHEFNKEYFLCEICEDSWESDGKGEKLYFEYLDLRRLTPTSVGNMGVDGSYSIAPHIDWNNLVRRKELAKILSELHRHDLNLSAGDWWEIDQDAT